jgi:hypothetical protein
MLLASPFITLLFVFLFLSGIFRNLSNGDPQAEKAYTLIASYLFAFFVLIGFSLAGGIFILAIVADKENKLRHLMNFVGMKPLAYYMGNIVADFILFSIPTCGFIILLFPLDIKYFIMNGSWAVFLAVMLSFGISMITLTYLFSFMFSSANVAFK